MGQKPALLQLESWTVSEHPVCSVAFGRRKLLSRLLAEVGAYLSSPDDVICEAGGSL